MVNKTGITLLGISQAISELTKDNKIIYNAADKAVMDSGFFIEGEVKESISGRRAEPKSVDTGQYLGSVKTLKDAPLQAEVISDVEHAEPLEFGTSKMQPRRHFTNTAQRNEHKVSDFIEEKIKNALN